MFSVRRRIAGRTLASTDLVGDAPLADLGRVGPPGHADGDFLAASSPIFAWSDAWGSDQGAAGFVDGAIDRLRWSRASEPVSEFAFVLTYDRGVHARVLSPSRARHDRSHEGVPAPVVRSTASSRNAAS